MKCEVYLMVNEQTDFYLLQQGPVISVFPGHFVHYLYFCSVIPGIHGRRTCYTYRDISICTPLRVSCSLACKKTGAWHANFQVVHPGSVGVV